MVFREKFTGRAEAPDLSHGRGSGRSSCAEELGRLKFLKGVVPVVLAYRAVLPADLPVFLGIRDTVFGLIHHTFNEV